jgi:hypothetical protein
MENREFTKDECKRQIRMAEILMHMDRFDEAKKLLWMAVDSLDKARELPSMIGSREASVVK